MNSLEIKFVNDLDFKHIHDLIMEHNPEQLCLYETGDDVDLDKLFTIAHIIQESNPNLYLIYKTYRDVYPIEELSAELALREIPFHGILLSDGDNFIFKDSRLNGRV